MVDDAVTVEVHALVGCSARTHDDGFAAVEVPGMVGCRRIRDAAGVDSRAAAVDFLGLEGVAREVDAVHERGVALRAAVRQNEVVGVEAVRVAREHPPVATEVDGDVLLVRNDTRVAVQLHRSGTAVPRYRRERAACLLEVAVVAVRPGVADSKVRARESARRPVRANDAVGNDDVLVECAGSVHHERSLAHFHDPVVDRRRTVENLRVCLRHVDVNSFDIKRAAAHLREVEGRARLCA